MKKDTLILLVAAGIGIYLWQQNKKTSGTGKVTAPPTSGKGGGTGANASTAGAYNGVLNPSSFSGGISWLTGVGASIGHLFDSNGNSTGGASLNAGAPAASDGSSDSVDSGSAGPDEIGGDVATPEYSAYE